MFLTSYISCKLRLLKLRTEGQTIKTSWKSYKPEIKILANSGLA